MRQDWIRRDVHPTLGMGEGMEPSSGLVAEPGAGLAPCPCGFEGLDGSGAGERRRAVSGHGGRELDTRKQRDVAAVGCVQHGCALRVLTQRVQQRRERERVGAPPR